MEDPRACARLIAAQTVERMRLAAEKQHAMDSRLCERMRCREALESAAARDALPVDEVLRAEYERLTAALEQRVGFETSAMLDAIARYQRSYGRELRGNDARKILLPSEREAPVPRGLADDSDDDADGGAAAAPQHQQRWLLGRDSCTARTISAASLAQLSLALRRGGGDAAPPHAAASRVAASEAAAAALLRGTLRAALLFSSSASERGSPLEPPRSSLGAAAVEAPARAIARVEKAPPLALPSAASLRAADIVAADESLRARMVDAMRKVYAMLDRAKVRRAAADATNAARAPSPPPV